MASKLGKRLGKINLRNTYLEPALRIFNFARTVDLFKNTFIGNQANAQN